MGKELYRLVEESGLERRLGETGRLNVMFETSSFISVLWFCLSEFFLVRYFTWKLLSVDPSSLVICSKIYSVH